ncbi:vegetative cell wall protein gp1-like [Panicum virgatum]|uniref:vegetative cell wall protein gp1-like n=1 Tax=Panicum virgatum TaxID=38727 RepID=UPI0019D6751B|nr:vegetative cell wall protein gp1-like [Panicum virgatum]
MGPTVLFFFIPTPLHCNPICSPSPPLAPPPPPAPPLPTPPAAAPATGLAHLDVLLSPSSSSSPSRAPHSEPAPPLPSASSSASCSSPTRTAPSRRPSSTSAAKTPTPRPRSAGATTPASPSRSGRSATPRGTSPRPCAPPPSSPCFLPAASDANAMERRHLQQATSGGASSRNLAPPARSISGGRKPPRPTTSTPSKKQRPSFVAPLPRPTAPPGGANGGFLSWQAPMPSISEPARLPSLPRYEDTQSTSSTPELDYEATVDGTKAPNLFDWTPTPYSTQDSIPPGGFVNFMREVAITTTMRISNSADLGLTSQLIPSLQMTNQASRRPQMF